MFQEIIQQVETRADQVKLSEVSDLNSFNDDIKTSLEAFYSDKKNTNKRLCGTLINSVLTQNKVTFLFSRRIFDELLAKDPQIKRNTIDSKTFKDFMTFVRTNKILTLLKEGEGVNSASVFEIRAQSVVDLVIKKVGTEFLLAQKDNCLKIHKKSSELEERPTKHPTETSHDIMINDSNEYTEQTASVISSGILVNPEHQELLNKALAVPAERLNGFQSSFLQDKQSKLKQYGSFTAKQLSILTEITVIPEKKESSAKERKSEQLSPALLKSILNDSTSMTEVILKLKHTKFNPNSGIRLCDDIVMWNRTNLKFNEMKDWKALTEFLSINPEDLKEKVDNFQFRIKRLNEQKQG